ncbi:DNA polymerase III subunit epsilon, partial [Limnobacter sp.]|uniref:DNA polymerase III subunit epsilon n=1 Tax=Limnobacter sp. TaxID=2003368 RepID=UPI0035180649
MRFVVLDTETTGLEVRQGHRIIEIGCIEVLGRQVTERYFHEYINPEREVDEGAYQVHGISNEMLADKPKFERIAKNFVDFIKGSTLIIHNAAFDVGFLDMELDRLGLGKVQDHVESVIDSLLMAREMFPGKRNNLDALCDRLGVNNAHRQLHGALLDSQILAEVYLAMTRGQDSLVIDAHGSHHA